MRVMPCRNPIIFLLIFLFFIGEAHAVEKALPANVTVNTIYNFSLDIGILTKNTASNSSLDVFIGVNKTGFPGFVQGFLFFNILDSSRKTVLPTSANISQLGLENFNSTIAKVNVPEIKTGKYFLHVSVTHPQANPGLDEDIFFVRKKFRNPVQALLDFLASIFFPV